MTYLDKVAEKIISRSRRTQSGCLEYQGALVNGYGVVSYHGRQRRVHRVMLAHATGDEGLLNNCPKEGYDNPYVLHSCDNRKCCEPSHLRVGNAQQNSDDVVARGRIKFNPNLPRKLTPDDVREIRREAVSWGGICDMMKKHEISQVSIMQVVNGKTYRHVK